MQLASARTAVLAPAMTGISDEIDVGFDRVLQSPGDHSERLYEAMRYAVIGGGKRLRPLLVTASADLFGVPRRQALRAGLAVEAIHVQSLIHDDLPCMDDDDLRRGKPSLHCAFDEATAVLAGDALLALAFDILADPDTHPDPAVRAEMIAGLARAAGPAGRAGGQMQDLTIESDKGDAGDVIRMQMLKTGVLIGWCMEAGAIMGYAAPILRRKLVYYANCVGLAFQIADDILDAEGDPDQLGKRVRKDAGQGKASFVSLFGVFQARMRAEHLVEQAIRHLDSFGEEADLLRELARYAIDRER